MQCLKTTPFHARTSELMQSAEWRRWGGYQIASSYEPSPDREYYAVRASAALFDVSPLAKYKITGSEARDYVQKLITRDVSHLAIGKVAYSPWCDQRGKMIDDGTFACLGDEHFQMTAAEAGDSWLQRVAAGFDVEIENISDDYGVLAIQGPTSLSILRELLGEAPAKLAFSESINVNWEGQTLWVSRTGYTGDLGFEVWVKSEQAVKLWDRIAEIGISYALVPAGIQALDIARIEAGLLMLDVEYVSALATEIPSQSSSPFELGLGWSVHFKKDDFIGREALLEEKEKNSTPYAFVGCVVDDVAYREAFERVGLASRLPVKAWRGIHPLFDGNGEQRGYTTCGTWSPTLQKYIMLAQVSPDFAEAGSSLFFDEMIDRHRERFPCSVCKLPFFDTPRKKEMYV